MRPPRKAEIFQVTAFRLYRACRNSGIQHAGFATSRGNGRAFVRQREVLSSNRDLAAKLDALAHKTELMSLQQESFAGSTRAQLKQLFEAMRQMMAVPADPPKRPIGFVTPADKK